MASGLRGCKLSLSQSNSPQFDLKEGVPRKPREKIWGSSNGINRAPACVFSSSFWCKCNSIFHTSCSQCSHLLQWIGNDFHWFFWPFCLTRMLVVPFGVTLTWLSIESNSIRHRWSCSWNKNQNCYITLHSSLFFCLKLGLVQLFPVRFLPNLKEKLFIIFFACLHLIFLCQCCQMSRILGQSEVSDNRSFWLFDRQVSNTFAISLR